MMRARSAGKILRGQAGQAALEFACTVMLFLTIVFGVIDVGRGVFEYNILASSAREGARVAIMAPPPGVTDNSDVINRTVASSAGIIRTDNGDTVTVTGTRTCTAVPCPTVTVTVQHSFTPVIPLIVSLVGNSISMSASSTMVVEK